MPAASGVRAGWEGLAGVAELAVDGAAEGDVWVEASAGVTQQVEHFIRRNAGGDQLEIGLAFGGVDPLHGPGEIEATVPDRGEAVDGVDGFERVAIRRSAGDVKVERLGRLEALAVEVAGCSSKLHGQRVGHAGDVGGHAGIAAPAQIAGDDHAADLAEGSAAPLRTEVEWQFIGGRCAIDAAADLYPAGVGEREIDVGADGLGGEAKLPLVRIFEPDGDVGIEEREGKLLIAVLEIDACVVGFDVGKATLAAGNGEAGGRLLRARGLQQHGGEVPLAVGSAF